MSMVLETLLMLSSHLVMSDSLWPYGLQHARFPVLCHLLELAQTHSIESVMASNHLVLCFPLLLLPSIFLSIKVSSNESALLIRWPNYWRFSISPSKVYYSWFPLGLTRLISLHFKGLLRVFSNTTVQNINSSVLNFVISHLLYHCCWVTSVLSHSARPHRRQPTRLPCPWDSPGKNTGVGCHSLLQCMKMKSKSEFAQSSPTQRPRGLQPTRLIRPWDFPGKSTGVGRHCLLHYIINSF